MTPPVPLGDVDPADPDSLAAALREADPDGRLHPVNLRRVVIGDDALDRLVDEVAAVAGGPSIVLLGDRTPMRRQEADLKPLVAERLRARFTVTEAWLGTPGHDLHADERVIAAAEAAVDGADVVVSVGSGTVTDIAKDVASRGRRPALVAVQTAASVNGFADDMSVLLRSGTKRTVPSRSPDVLVVDLPVLAGAPAAMNVAGLGDLMSVWTAPADWYLSGLLGMDAGYHEAPGALVRDRVRRLLACADGIPRRDRAVLRELAEALTVSGLSMTLAGTTSPSSGSEHVVSHLVDMAREQQGTRLALHGAQVGVAAVVTAAAWEVALEAETLFPPGTDPFPEAAAMEPRVREAFGAIDPSGAVGDECWAGYRAKLARWHAQRPVAEAVLADWDRHRRALRALVAPAEAIGGALVRAGAPSRFAELDPPVDAALARWALANAHLMRDRFSVLDLLAFTGRWDAAAVDRVLARAAAAGGGL